MMRIPLKRTATNSLPPWPASVVFTLSRDAEVTQPYKRYYQSHGVTTGEFCSPLLSSGWILRETDFTITIFATTRIFGTVEVT
jgi:hypothetical protein